MYLVELVERSKAGYLRFYEHMLAQVRILHSTLIIFIFTKIKFIPLCNNRKHHTLIMDTSCRKHRMTKLSPENGEKLENSLHIQQMHENYYNKVKPTNVIKFKVNDRVRIVKTKPKFGRGYDKKTPEEIYKIVKIIRKFPRVLYQIETLDGEEVIGNFYQEQLTKVISQDQFIVEKILKKSKGKAFVKFLGYEKPEWVLQKNISAHKDMQ